MRSRTRNLSILGLVLVVLAGAAAVILTKATKLGLDLKGGTELVYEGRSTPKVPKVTPQAIDDALNTIRKRTDSLGVSEPEIQRAGANQISIGLPDVKDPERAIQQVGSTAQLQFYDFEPNDIIRKDGKITTLLDAATGQPQLIPQLSSPTPNLWDAVQLAAKAKPRPEAGDLPPDGADTAKLRQAGVDPKDTKAVRSYYDRQNDTRSGAAYYLFGPTKRPLGPDGRPVPAGKDEQISPATSCKEALSQFAPPRGQTP